MSRWIHQSDASGLNEGTLPDMWEGLEACPTLSESKEEQLYQSWNSNFSLPQIEREGINMDYMNSWNNLIKERLLCNMAKKPK